MTKHRVITSALALFLLFVVMMATSFAGVGNLVYPKFKAFRYGSSTGPCVGCKLYTCVPGSAGLNSLKTSYSDATGTAQNTNPVILDSNGEATVWYTGMAKLVLYSATNVLMWSLDWIPVYAFSQTIFDSSEYDSINAAVAAVGSASATIVVSTNEILTASLIVPSNVQLRIEKGGMITKASTYILTINGPLDAGSYQIFSGFAAGDVTLPASSGNIGRVYGARPEWWGTGTTAWNCANAAAAVTLLSRGTYTLSSNPSAIVGPHAIVGMGPDQSIIEMASGCNMAINIYNGANANSYVNLSGFKIHSDVDTTNVAIHAEYLTLSQWRDIFIDLLHPSTNTSVGIEIWGGASNRFQNVNARASVPISFGPQTVLGGSTTNLHFHFQDMELNSSATIAQALPLIRVTSGCSLSDVVFDGQQLWAGGYDGIKWESGSLGGSKLAFSNVKWENGDGADAEDAHGYLFNHSPTTASDQLLFTNCTYSGTGSNGWYLRNVGGSGATFIMSYGPDGVPVDANSPTVDKLTFINSPFNEGTSSMGTLSKWSDAVTITTWVQSP